MRKRVWELADKSVREWIDNRANEMMADKLVTILKRYLRESKQSERILASRIGVHHHILHQWLTSSQSPMKGRLALVASFLGRVGYL